MRCETHGGVARQKCSGPSVQRRERQFVVGQKDSDSGRYNGGWKSKQRLMSSVGCSVHKLAFPTLHRPSHVLARQ